MTSGIGGTGGGSGGATTTPTEIEVRTQDLNGDEDWNINNHPNVRSISMVLTPGATGVFTLVTASGSQAISQAYLDQRQLGNALSLSFEVDGPGEVLTAPFHISGNGFGFITWTKVQ